MPSKASSGKNPFRPGNDPPTLRPAFPGLGLVPRGLDVLSDMRVGIKINLVLLGLGLLPPLAALLFLHQAGADHFQNVLALYIAAFLVVFYPLAKVLEELLVLRQIRRVNRFVEEVKSGRRTPYYELPDEQGDEHHVLRLEHNIFWMVHGLKTRESRLEDTLSKLDHARRRIL